LVAKLSKTFVFADVTPKLVGTIQRAIW
jgi:hypothetical protein